MKKLRFALLLFLTACSSTPLRKEKVFIDANISADVYFGDKKVGTTPFMEDISGQERELLTLRKDGYKPVSLPINKIYSSSHRGGAFHYSTDASSSDCSGKYYNVSSDSNGSPEGCLYLPLITTLIPSYGIGLTVLSMDLTPQSAYVEYDRDSYYVEMVPLNKKAYTKDDLKRLRIKLMVLKSFKELKAGDSERTFALATMTGAPFALPAPDATPGAYLKTMTE